MEYFQYKNGRLYIEKKQVQQLAQEYGTPLYLYSKGVLANNWQKFKNALPESEGQIYYAVKANSNLAILNWLVQQGAGFDIVSEGELERVLVAGADPAKIVYSGVAKSERAIKRALAIGISCFNVESFSELERINQLAAQTNCIAPVALRINPDIDSKTHPYISTGLKENKFGIDYDLALPCYRQAKRLKNIQLKGIDCHIGSQITKLSPFIEALEKVLLLLDKLLLEGIVLEHIDMGGGLGVSYLDESPPTIDAYINMLRSKLAESRHSYLKLYIEPGRAIIAESGILVTQVEYLKHQHDRHFAIVDAGMNDLIRPALYDAWMRIESVVARAKPAYLYNVVGPVCESSDFLGKQRLLALEEGDFLVIRDVGAYGFSMSSQYNSRPRAAEVWVDGTTTQIIREREILMSLWQGEHLLNCTD